MYNTPEANKVIFIYFGIIIGLFLLFAGLNEISEKLAMGVGMSLLFGLALIGIIANFFE